MLSSLYIANNQLYAADSILNHTINFMLNKSLSSKLFYSLYTAYGGLNIQLKNYNLANKYLGKTIDIHSGGQDLIFPHHENEIAQAKAHDGNKIANYWMHNGFVNFGEEKIKLSSEVLRDLSHNRLRSRRKAPV